MDQFISCRVPLVFRMITFFLIAAPILAARDTLNDKASGVTDLGTSHCKNLSIV